MPAPSNSSRIWRVMGGNGHRTGPGRGALSEPTYAEAMRMAGRRWAPRSQ